MSLQSKRTLRQTCSYSVKLIITKTTEIQHIPLWTVFALMFRQGNFPRKEKVDGIERMLKGGNDSESNYESAGKEAAASEDEIDDHLRRVSCNTRLGRATTRLSLI